MISCPMFSDAEKCLAHREEIVAYREKFRLPLPVYSMCASCRRARPEKDRIESEELLGKLREAGL